MTFRLRMSLELEKQDGDLAESIAVPVDVVYETGKWRAQCSDPPVSTLRCDGLEESLVGVAKLIQHEWCVAPAG